MSLYDWLLFLHVGSAFALATALTIYTIAVVVGWRSSSATTAIAMLRVAKPANILTGVGFVGTIVFGIWLAFEAPGDYSIFDGWVLLAFLLWAVAVETGRRTGKAYEPAERLAAEVGPVGAEIAGAELFAALRTQRGLLFHAATVVLFVALLVDMIFKPGA